MGLFCTEGILIQKTNYSETSVIVKVFTLNEGIKSFIYPGAKRKGKKGNLLIPLSILQIEYYSKSNSSLAKISNVEFEITYKTIPFDPIKSSIVFFINEVIYNSVKEEQYNPDLYHYLKSALHILDLLDNSANFALQFLLNFTKYLGFYPVSDNDPTYFDLLEGKLTRHLPNHPNYVGQENTKLIHKLLGTKFDEVLDLKLNTKKRRELTYDLLKYYQVIFDNFKEIKSLPILEVTFHD